MGRRLINLAFYPSTLFCLLEEKLQIIQLYNFTQIIQIIQLYNYSQIIHNIQLYNFTHILRFGNKKGKLLRNMMQLVRNNILVNNLLLYSSKMYILHFGIALLRAQNDKSETCWNQDFCKFDSNRLKLNSFLGAAAAAFS